MPTKRELHLALAKAALEVAEELSKAVRSTGKQFEETLFSNRDRGAINEASNKPVGTIEGAGAGASSENTDLPTDDSDPFLGSLRSKKGTIPAAPASSSLPPGFKPGQVHLAGYPTWIHEASGASIVPYTGYNATPELDESLLGSGKSPLVYNKGKPWPTDYAAYAAGEGEHAKGYHVYHRPSGKDTYLNTFGDVAAWAGKLGGKISKTELDLALTKAVKEVAEGLEKLKKTATWVNPFADHPHNKGMFEGLVGAGVPYEAAVNEVSKWANAPVPSNTYEAGLIAGRNHAANYFGSGSGNPASSMSGAGLKNQLATHQERDKRQGTGRNRPYGVHMDEIQSDLPGSAGGTVQGPRQPISPSTPHKEQHPETRWTAGKPHPAARKK